MLESIFEQCAVVSGLVTESELISAWKEMTVSGSSPKAEEIPDRLAEILVRRGVLNHWQAGQLLKGQKRFTLGKYKIFNSIGRGGMGEVYKARHMETQQIVAIKVLPSKKATESAVKNFENEIRFMSRLSHPNLVAAIEAGFDGNVNYLVTEYVPGPDLSKLVKNRGPLRQESAASVIIQAARGLQHAHSEGFVHRDVKPGNILVTMNGMAKLSDLGLASHREFECDAEKKSKIVGTADYIAPDQVRDPANPDSICDIYSLGCTLYFIVTGKPPYPGGSASEKVKKHQSETEYPTNPALINPSLSEEFTDVIACMMAKVPEERIASAQDVIHFLSQWADGSPQPIRFMDAKDVFWTGTTPHWASAEEISSEEIPSEETQSEVMCAVKGSCAGEVKQDAESVPETPAVPFSIPLPPPLPENFPKVQERRETKGGVSSVFPPPLIKDKEKGTANTKTQEDQPDAVSSGDPQSEELQGKKGGRLGNFFKRLVPQSRPGTRVSERSASKNLGPAPDFGSIFAQAEDDTGSTSEK